MFTWKYFCLLVNKLDVSASLRFSRRTQQPESCVVISRNDSFNESTAEMFTRSLIFLITGGCKKESNCQVNLYPKCEVL